MRTKKIYVKKKHILALHIQAWVYSFYIIIVIIIIITIIIISSSSSSSIIIALSIIAEHEQIS